MPIIRTEKPPEDRYWEDLDGYADALVERVCWLWETTWEAVHEAFTEVTAQD